MGVRLPKAIGSQMHGPFLLPAQGTMSQTWCPEKGIMIASWTSGLHCDQPQMGGGGERKRGRARGKRERERGREGGRVEYGAEGYSNIGLKWLRLGLNLRLGFKDKIKISTGLELVRVRIKLMVRMLQQIYTDRWSVGDNDNNNEHGKHRRNRTVIINKNIHYVDFMSFKNFFHLTP